jgi:hypothetical protein
MHPSIKLRPAYEAVVYIYCIIRSKRKSDEIEKPEDPILRTCSDCYPFRASWSTKSWCAGGITYIGVWVVVLVLAPSITFGTVITKATIVRKQSEYDSDSECDK